MMSNNNSSSNIDTTRYTSLFQEAAILNMEGIHCLTSRDGDGAYRNFKRGLQIMTQMTREFDTLQEQQEQDGDITMEEEDEEPLEFWTSSKTVPLAIMDTTCYYVYNHALVFAPPSRPSHCNLASCVAVLIFNTALTFHQRGLPKALALYEQVISIVEACAPLRGEDDGADDDVSGLQVVARNNHTHILSAMGQVDMAKAGLDELRELLPRMQMPEMQDGEHHVSSALFATDDVAVLEELVLNILVPGTTVVAAAA